MMPTSPELREKRFKHAYEGDERRRTRILHTIARTVYVAHGLATSLSTTYVNRWFGGIKSLRGHMSLLRLKLGLQPPFG